MTGIPVYVCTVKMCRRMAAFHHVVSEGGTAKVRDWGGMVGGGGSYWWGRG